MTIIKRSYFIVLFAFILTAGYGIALVNVPYLQSLRDGLTDALLQQISKFASLPSDLRNITILTIDEESLQKLHQSWPISRGIYAALLDRLSSSDMKPLAIGMDLFFAGPSDRPEDDYLLSEALARCGNVVIVNYVNESGRIIEPESSLAKRAAGVGFVSAPRDGDLVVRKTYPFLRFSDGRTVPSFPALVYSKSRGTVLDDISHGMMRINYFAGTNSFRIMPIWKALSSPDDKDIFKDKIVLIGTVVAIHHDTYPTPLGMMPGIVINANIILDFLSKRWLVPIPGWIMYLLLFVVAALTGIATYRFGILGGAILCVSLLSAGLLLSAFAIWNDTVFDLFGYSFAAISSFVFALSWASISAMVENVHLSRLVMTDRLTGVCSHRYFEITLKKEIESASVEKGELSLAILDIDDFKMVNDTYGHEAGNDTLRSVARIIKERVLPPGIVARFCVDEFVVLLPGISSEKAYNVVSGIVEAARRMAFPWLPKDRTITISSGLTTVRCYRELTYSDIMKSADAELYKAKSSGKNRVSVKMYFNK